MRAADYFRFLLAWATNPLKLGAVAPSGNALAQMMTSKISPTTGPVLELGPGTGILTRALLARGVRERDLTLVEHHGDFARLLNQRFPAARVVRLDAARLARENLFEDGMVGAVVSGLPLRSMTLRKVIAILAASFACMRTDGAFYQFTYGPIFSVPHRVLDRLGLRATRIGYAFANLPPAVVYEISRQPQGCLDGRA